MVTWPPLSCKLSTTNHSYSHYSHRNYIWNDIPQVPLHQTSQWFWLQQLAGLQTRGKLWKNSVHNNACLRGNGTEVHDKFNKRFWWSITWSEHLDTNGHSGVNSDVNANIIVAMAARTPMTSNVTWQSCKVKWQAMIKMKSIETFPPIKESRPLRLMSFQDLFLACRI